MRVIVAIVLLIGGCRSTPPSKPPDLAQVAAAISGAALATDPESPLVRIEVVPIPGEENLYVAIEDWQDHWWGTFECFKYENGHTHWVATVSDTPDEQSILEVRGVRLQGFTCPFVEVFGITHMGNGSCYLYRLEGKHLRLVLKTRAVDQHQDLNLIRGSHLTVEYRDLNGDGYVDVEFTGIVEEYSDDPHIESPIRSYPCRKVFLWNPAENRFCEDKSQRKGFECYASCDD